MNVGCECAIGVLLAGTAFGGVLDAAWLKGTTDRDPLAYGKGEEIVFTATPEGLDGAVPEGGYFLDWRRSGDDGNVETGRVAFTGAPFAYATRMEVAGFVRLEARVVGRDGVAVVPHRTCLVLGCKVTK